MTDLLAMEETAASYLMKKPRVEEEEEEEDGGNSTEIVLNHLRFKYVPEREPQWDVDSYDGREYKSDPEDSKYFSDEDEYEEYRIRKRETFESKGFLPDYINGIYSFGDLEAPAGNGLTNREVLTNLATLCVKKFNEDKGKFVEVDSIVRGTVRGGGRWKIYITLMAREYEKGPLVEYQAKVMKFAGDCKPPFPILCRRSPKPGI